MNQRHDRDLLDVFMMVLYFVAGMFLGHNYSSWSGFAKDLVASISTLFAAFLGAWYAYRLQSEKDQRIEVAGKAESLNAAIFELIRMQNKLIALRNQFIEPVRGSPDRDFEIKPVAGGDLGSMSIDYKSLGFMFLSEDPNVVGELTLLDQDVAGTINVISQRSRMHVEELQPIVEQLSARNGAAIVTIPQIITALGPMKTKQFRDLSKYMVEGIDSGIAGVEKMVEDLNRLGRPLVPGFRVLRIQR